MLIIIIKKLHIQNTTKNNQRIYPINTPHAKCLPPHRQFKVTPGDLVTVDELRHLPVGEDIILRNALMVGGVHETVIGQPLVPAVEVSVCLLGVSVLGVSVLLGCCVCVRACVRACMCVYIFISICVHVCMCEGARPRPRAHCACRPNHF